MQVRLAEYPKLRLRFLFRTIVTQMMTLRRGIASALLPASLIVVILLLSVLARITTLAALSSTPMGFASSEV